MTSTRYLLIVAIFLHFHSLTFSETCTKGYDFDIFKLYTTLPYRSHLNKLLSIGGPNLEGINPTEPCFQFTGTKGLKVTDTNMIKQIINSTCAANEVSMYGSVFFKGDEIGGTVLELYHVNETFLGFSVCRVNSEVTVTYRHNDKLHIESFPFKFYSGKWYKVAVIMSGNLIRVYVNCSQIGEKLVSLPSYCPAQSNIELSAGSGCLNKELFPCSNNFTGSLQSVGLQSGTDGVAKYCPKLKNKAQCPVCGSFVSLLKKHHKLQGEMTKLQTSFNKCNQTLSAMNCSIVPRTCNIQNVTISDNTFITKTDGHICYCRDGMAHCTNPNTTARIHIPPPAPTTRPTDPPKPSTRTSQSSSTCMESRNGQTHVFKINESVNFPVDGGKKCDEVYCHGIGTTGFSITTSFSCSDSNQVSQSCNRNDSRALGRSVCCGYCSACLIANCPVNSTCNASIGSYECICNKGLQLSDNKTSCNDINECTLSSNDTNVHNCPANAQCVNTFGSFYCQCPSGFKLQRDGNNLQCVDINECAANGTAKCSSLSTCVNTDGDYRCDCRQGYMLVGKHECVTVCETPCQNGGRCTAPSKCTCASGFTGPLCENDVNECNDTRLNECNASKGVLCVNTFGGYFCSCQKGYQWDSNRKLCVDVNECDAGIHKCLNGVCENVFGGYMCSCIGRDCKGHCIKDGGIILNRQRIKLGTCDECTCKDGKLECKRRCDCNAPDVSLACCPNCHRNVCRINEQVIVEEGDYYIDPNNRCNRTKCVASNGGFVLQAMNVGCPSLGNCPRNKTYTPEGACCPVCQLPTCTPNTQPVITNCDRCTCDGTNWTCTGVANCPRLNCPKEQQLHLPDRCCPVCHGTVVNKLSCNP